MNTKPLLSGEAVIEIERKRYDELLHKEKHLEIIVEALSNMFGYTDIDRFKEYLGVANKEVEVLDE